MRKRIVSLLLVLCLLAGIMPTAVFTAEPEDALYAQMLELGLVDDEGALIEDNTFTVEDGTRLYSLDELIEWLNQCDESDLDKIITVDATGRSATVEQIMYALIIEYQMADVAGQLNTLASGEYAVTRSTELGAADSYIHDMKLSIEVSRNEKILTLNVYLKDKNKESYYYRAPYDIPVEVGAFADFFTNNNADYAADGSQVPGTNCFKEFTIKQGDTSVEFKLDLAKLRENYIAKQDGLLAGNTFVLFQARTVAGTSKIPESSAAYCLKIADSTDVDPVVDAITGGIIVGRQDIDNGTIIPYGLNWGLNDDTANDKETIDGVNYFKITTPIISAKDSAYIDEYFGWMQEFSRASALGMGDAYHRFNLQHVSLWEKDSKAIDVPGLSVMFNNRFEDIATSSFWYNKNSFTEGSEALEHLLDVAKAFGKSWDDPKSDNGLLMFATMNNNFEMVTFSNVEVPFTSNRAGYVTYPRVWYLNEDWIDNNENGNTRPSQLVIHGAMTLVDETAPTVQSIDTCARTQSGINTYTYSNFYPGDFIPIVVTFNEPVYGDYELVYQVGTGNESLSSSRSGDSITGDVVSSEPVLSNTRVFYFKVDPTDCTEIQVLGVRPVDENCKDVFGNAFENSIGADYQIKSVALLEDHILGGQLQQSLLSLTATQDAQNPCLYTFRVDLNNDQTFKTMWYAWAHPSEGTVSPEVTVYVDNDYEKSVSLTLAVEGTGSNQKYYLTGTLTLPTVSTSTDRMAEVHFGDQLYYGIYTKFTQAPVVYAGTDAYSISLVGEWPSGVENLIFMQDEESLTLTSRDNNTGYTYKYVGTDDVRWTVDNTKVISLTPVGTGTSLTLTDAQSVKLNIQGEGTATISLVCGNNGTRTTTASNSITVTVKDNGKPTLRFPSNADSVYARQSTDQEVLFTSNLKNHDPASNDSEGKITASLYKGSSYDENATPIWTTKLGRSATSLTIPGEYLTQISKGDTPSYVLRLTATAQVDGNDRDLSTVAKIIVCAQPAVIKLTGLDNPTFTDDESIEIGWTVDNFDLATNPDDCQFQFTIEKNGKTVYSYSFNDNDEKSNTGSYTLTPDKLSDHLKDYYIVTAKAKNGADPKWSIASSTITVYKLGAMDILVGGEKVDSFDLKNEISGGTTTTPTIHTYSGETLDGLTNAQAVAKLRTELSLMETIGINFNEYEWSILDDTVKWSTSTGRGDEITDELQRAVTINYRQGMLYSPLEKYSYTCYLPEVIMLLCGIRDGSNIISVEHNSLSKLNDSVTVNVKTLKDKLYLFQFTPAVKTEISYEDGLGETHTLYTNDDGSLALFEPNGIASDLRAASINSKGDSYRGTITNFALKSGEGDSTRGELYPMNIAELRLAATAQVQLLMPDGSPLAETDVILRGGVYRNRYAVEEREDAYCAGAKFALETGETASLDGKEDQIFHTDENGILTVHMDLSQFTSEHNPDAVGVGDSLEFIFELRFLYNKYYPEIVVVDGSLNSRDAMRSGENIVTLIEAKKEKPFVAVQTISYTGREIDARRHTGVVGPSSNYPSAILDSTIMLWGMDDISFDDTGYYFDLRSQQTGVLVPRQNRMTVNDATYPFSSIPLVNNVVTLESSSFVNFDGTRKTPLEAALYDGNGGLVSTISIPFGIADLSAIEKVEDAPSVMSLMANIAAYSTVGGANTEYGIVNKVSDGVMNDALSFLEKMGGKAGVVKAILMPTADPTRYEVYLWTGINTLKLEDLDYDQNGVSLEPSFIGQDYDSLLGQVNDTFTLSDFQAMADGSYFDDRSSLYGAASSAIGLPIMIQLEGWLNAEIRYNFDKGHWEVLTTGGGFTAGAQLEYEKALNLTVYGIPLTASFKVRGGAVVDFQTAIRYAEQLGYEWNDDTANKVNDYLTALRINAYFEFFGGLGFDKGFTAKIGLYGTIEINNENRFLTRKYLKKQSDRDMAGQYLALNGEAGIKAALGVGPLVTEITVISLGYSTGWDFNEWGAIDDYWEEASSGLVDNWLGDETSGQSFSLYNSRSAMIVSEPVVKLQSRDYLDEGDRIWLGGDTSFSFMSLDDPNKLAVIETNSFPFSTPLLSDDGSILVYLSDADSTDVTDVEVRYSLYDDYYECFPDGEGIPDGADGFSGYGDSSVDFDGTSDFAGAIWLREAATTGLKAGTEVDEDQQRLLLNGLEVVASIWNGNSWTTTRLTDNGFQEFNPVIAVNSDGTAIAVWRSVQTDENAYTFSQNRILCRIYDGAKWSDETYTLYNGSAGDVTGISAEMLEDGTAAIAFSVDDESGSSEIYYTVVDTAAASPEDNAKTIRATTNTYTDNDPQLTTVGDLFVLGWNSVQALTGAEQHDVNLWAFDKIGAPKSVLPESLSDMVSTAAYDGQFTFVKGADSLDELSLLWNDANAGDDDNDVIRAIKFIKYGDNYISSAAIEVAELPERTGLNHMDARVANDDGTDIQAVMQCITYSDTEFDDISYSYELDGVTYSGTGYFPKETINLLSASAAYTDNVEVVSTLVDYTTLATDSYVPVNFTVSNQGMNIIDSVTFALDGAETQIYTGLTLLPGQSKTFSVVTKTGAVIKDLHYTVTAEFTGAETCSASGTVYLDYPDVGISGLTVTKEQDGIRTVLANLYNQSAAALNKPDRRVVLGVYSDPECETPLEGKYFEDGSEGSAYEVILTGDTLASIDSTGYTQKITFQIGDYMKDAGLQEITNSGVTLFVKAHIEQQVNGEWIVLPEADGYNNQKHITFDSLLTRNDNAPTTISVEIDNGETTTANVQVRNNSLQPRTSGNLVAALLDGNGNLLETKNVGDLALGAEESKEISIAFSESGARVVLRYGEAVADDTTSNANAASITIDGLPLTIDSFDEDGSVTLENVSLGQYLLTVIPEGDGATVTVNGETVENGMVAISVGPHRRVVTVTITAADGSTTRTYTIRLIPDPSQIFDPDDELPDTLPIPVYDFYTLRFVTNGGSNVAALRRLSGTTIDLAAYTTTRSGYIFTGWYADKNLTEEVTTVKLTGNTTVYAGWQKAAASLPFTDVPEGSYYEEAVHWAVENGITTGTTATAFSPDATCTRAQAVTFLWRAAGCPIPGNSEMPFRDVVRGSYYETAVLWAVENGITFGTSETTFSPDAECTRAQIVTFLWRAQESPAAGTFNPFTDVAADDYYADAVLWAVENGITFGTSDTTFSPDADCTRAQIVTFLWRALTE